VQFGNEKSKANDFGAKATQLRTEKGKLTEKRKKRKNEKDPKRKPKNETKMETNCDMIVRYLQHVISARSAIRCHSSFVVASPGCDPLLSSVGRGQAV